MFRTAILTISDSCYTGERSDESGLLIEVSLPHETFMVAEKKIVPDDLEDIKGTLIHLVDSGELDLIITTGGTGFSPKDVTPEATAMVIQKPAPGLEYLMYSHGLNTTLHAALSRAKCGIRHETLIINLPGSPKSVAEYITILLPILPHAIKLIKDEASEDEHNFINS